MHRQFLSPVSAAACVVALGACGLTLDESYQNDAALPANVTAVRLDDIGSGSVTVRGGAAESSITRTVRYRGERPEEPTHRVTGGVLTLSGCGSRCAVNYTVELPAGIPVSGRTSHGSIRLTRVGQVNVATRSGSIHLDGVAGSVTARASNGRIEGRGLNGGAIDAQTSNSAISLTLSTAQSIRAKTSNGEITVTVPPGRYRVTTHTSNGDRDIAIPNDPSAEHRVDLATSNGDITVSPA